MSWRPACTTTSTAGSASTRASGAGRAAARRAGRAPRCAPRPARRGRAPPPAPGRAAPGSGARTRTPCRSPRVRGRRRARPAPRSQCATILRPGVRSRHHSCGCGGASRGRNRAPAGPTGRGGHRPLGAGPADPRAARGLPTRAREVLVVGVIHGNERGRQAVVARLRRLRPPRGTALWLVEDANPDGAAAGARHNAHGVDLNRNFPYRWRAAGRRLRVRRRTGLRARDRRRCSASSSASARA